MITAWARPKPLPCAAVVPARARARKKSGKLNPARDKPPTVKNSRRDGPSHSRPRRPSKDSIEFLQIPPLGKPVFLHSHLRSLYIIFAKADFSRFAGGSREDGKRIRQFELVTLSRK